MSYNKKTAGENQRFFVGMVGFEPTTSPTRTARASRAAPHPDAAKL